MAIQLSFPKEDEPQQEQHSRHPAVEPPFDLDDLTKFGKALLWVLTITGGLCNYRAITEMTGAQGGASQTLLVAFLVGVSTTVVLTLLWHMAFSIAPAMSSHGRRCSALLICAFTAFFAVSISSYANAITLFGWAAVERAWMEVVGEAEGALTQAHEDALASRQFVGVLNTIAAQYSADAADEVARGTFSGIPGDGLVAKALRDAAGSLSRLAQEIASAEAEQDGNLAVAKEALTCLQDTAANRDIGPRERLPQIRGCAAQLDQVFAEMRQTSALTTLQQAARLLREDAQLSTLSFRTERQRQAAEDVNRRLKDDAARLLALTETISESQTKQLVRLEPEHPMRAVLTQWRDFVLGWVTALAIDLAPLPVLLWLVLGRRELNAGMRSAKGDAP